MGKTEKSILRVTRPSVFYDPNRFIERIGIRFRKSSVSECSVSPFPRRTGVESRGIFFPRSGPGREYIARPASGSDAHTKLNTSDEDSRKTSKNTR